VQEALAGCRRHAATILGLDATPAGELPRRVLEDRFEPELGHGVELAVERDGLISELPLEKHHRLPKPSGTLGRRHADGLELIVDVPRAEAEGEAVAGEMLEGRGPFGQQHGF
jgi:hypothetical protein